MEAIETHEQNPRPRQYSGKVSGNQIEFSLWIYLQSDPYLGIPLAGMGNSFPSERKCIY